MITLKKIATLKPRVQIRKIADAFKSIDNMDEEYKDGLIGILLRSDEIDDHAKRKALSLIEDRDFDGLYYFLLTELGESFADWDFISSGILDRDRRRVFEHYLYLDGIRSPYNLGSIFRSSDFFGVKEIFLSPSCPSPMHERAKRTSMGTVDVIPYREKSLEELEGNVFALELGGTDIEDFEFPERGICIVGSEESGVEKRALEKAKSSCGVVSIRGYGAKASLNVASAISILLNRWAEWEIKKEARRPQ